MADIQYTSVNELDDASTLDGSEALHGVQSGNDVKITPAQIKEYFGVGLAVRSADCETTATTEIKEVTISDYEPTENDIVAITFDYANSWGDTTASTVSYPKLRINDSYDFNVCDSRGNPAGKGCWKAGDTIEFRLRGNKAIILTSDVRQVNTDGTVIMSDGQTYYNKQSVDSILKKSVITVNADNTTISGTDKTLLTSKTLPAGVYLINLSFYINNDSEEGNYTTFTIYQNAELTSDFGQTAVVIDKCQSLRHYAKLTCVLTLTTEKTLYFVCTPNVAHTFTTNQRGQIIKLSEV